MTAATNILQTLLNQPSPFTFLGCIAAALIFLILLKVVVRTLSLAKQTLKFGRTFLPKLGIWFAAKVCIVAGFLYICKDSAHDYLQYVETRWLNPVDTSGQYAQLDTSATVGAFEVELQRHTYPGEFNQLRDSIHAWNREFGLTPTAVYECMLPECSMNPFIIRPDGIAAGAIQFTGNGLSGSGVSLEFVKNVCHRRNMGQMTALMGWYFRSRLKGRKMSNGLDVYLLVFAPDYMGYPAEKTLYAAPTREYEKNRGLDGWKIESGKIYRSPFAVDGRITAGELGLWMRAKTLQLIKKHNTIKSL